MLNLWIVYAQQALKNQFILNWNEKWFILKFAVPFPNECSPFVPYKLKFFGSCAVDTVPIKHSYNLFKFKSIISIIYCARWIYAETFYRVYATSSKFSLLFS